MQVDNICRCCLSKGPYKDLNTTYIFFNKKEVYSDMLNECFNIVLHTFNSGKICDGCIKNLRSSLEFKQRILKCEQEFLKKIKDIEVDDDKQVVIKIEPNADVDDDSDDYFLSDTVKETEIVKCESEMMVKKKPEQKKKIKNGVKKTVAKTGKWQTEKIKSLVTRLAHTINDTPTNIKLEHEINVADNCVLNDAGDCTLPNKALSKKSKTNRKINVKTKESLYADRKVNIIWSSRISNEKLKHKENLQTILKFSNAIPFKNKSLLGFICGYCDATYPDPIDLRRHTENDHSKERLQFKSNFDMTDYNVKLDVTDLSCNLCDEKMENLKTLKEHLVKIHSKTIYSDIKDFILQFKLKKGDVYDCAICTSTYETFKMLKQHMNKHYCNYICSQCDSSFATKRSLNAHTTTHQEGSFKCDYCEKIFSSRPKKLYHEKRKHLGAKYISNCPYCDEKFQSYYQRNQHLVKVHNNEAQYKCNVCNKSYVLKTLLTYHIKKNHLMERNCQCTKCGLRFFGKKALKAHMVSHTGERNYPCEVCHKSYARKYTLREHMRIHNNDRRFKCESCGMSFVQKCSLKSHLLSNHGISMAASDITTS